MSRYTNYSGRVVSVVAVLLMVLTVMSLALAMLTENLKVNTFINTGELDISYDDIEVFESGEAEGKDVGKCEYKLETVNGVEVLTILIENGYPGYECTIHFNITNTGTIPVVGPFFNMTSLPEGVQVYFNPAELVQLHPGDKAGYSIFTKVLQNAEENSDYVITIEITYIQWNEYIMPSRIGGYVWEDLDRDGIWDIDVEPALANVKVYLRQNSIDIASTTTNECGYYEFTVSPGTYIIAPELPQGYTFTTPEVIEITAQPGSSYLNNNFGMYTPPAQPTPELTVKVDFRETNTNFTQCPARLGTRLPRTDNGSYIVNATVQAGKVNNVNPGAFYFVMNISGIGITRLNVTIKYDNQFNIEDGKDGRIQVYVLNTTTGCTTNITSIGTLAYNVNNEINIATINITLHNSLPPDAIILVYAKYKDSIKGSSWDALDKHFEVDYTVETNIGSVSGQAVIQIFKK